MVSHIERKRKKYLKDITRDKECLVEVAQLFSSDL